VSHIEQLQILQKEFEKIKNRNSALEKIIGNYSPLIHGGGLQGGQDLPITFKTKTVIETVNNNTTLQDDNELFLPMLPNFYYVFMLFNKFNSSSVADIRSSFIAPSGATGGHNEINANGSTLFAFGANSNQSGGGNDSGVILYGYVTMGSTAGNLQYQFAQATAEVSDTSVLAGAILRLYKGKAV